jgi:uncharacterized peroxidase-related enzyme
MKTFTVPVKEQTTEAAHPVFDYYQKAIGFVPNLYATIGLSGNALGSYFTFQQAQAKSSFGAKEREAIFLAVSEVNQCSYCLSAHTAIGKMNGYSDEETVQLRNGTIADKKLNVITQLAASIAKERGRADEALVDEFYALGYDDTALIDLVALVADKTFANYVHNLTKIPIDFPVVKPLGEFISF